MHEKEYPINDFRQLLYDPPAGYYNNEVQIPKQHHKHLEVQVGQQPPKWRDRQPVVLK